MAELADRVAARLIALAAELRSLAVLPLAAAASLSDQQDLIEKDASQWLEVLGSDDGAHGLHGLLWAFGEFRALYYHRLRQGNALGRLVAMVAAHLFKPTAGLSIETAKIGSGLFIAHGQACCLSAEEIGRNCYVHQGVTIGWDYRSARRPVIGDGVFIGAGAVILGDVTVGDGARIGANAVVLSDVPAGATAVGTPARIVEHDGGEEAEAEVLSLRAHSQSQAAAHAAEALRGRTGGRRV